MVKVSVIIAVYNAEKFVTKAVESALSQPETEEIILIEDGSKDKSLGVCEGLASKYDKVFLYRHPGGVNKGAPASFNLGMKKASCEYLSILGADDYFLPGRFKFTIKIFEQNPDCDGVYEAIGRHVENEAGKERWQDSGKAFIKLHTVNKVVNPEELGLCFINGEIKEFSLNGLVFKSSVINETGYMNQSLRLHQDTDFIVKLALTSKLLPGKIDEPVAMWRIHDHNRITAKRSNFSKRKHKIKFWVSIHKWSKNNSSEEIQLAILTRLIQYARKAQILNYLPTRYKKHNLVQIIRLTFFLLTHPFFLFDPLFTKIFRNED